MRARRSVSQPCCGGAEQEPSSGTFPQEPSSGTFPEEPSSGTFLRNWTLTPSALLAGINLCSNNNGDCSQLCLPTSPTTRACMCTAGYSLKSGQQSCEGKTPPPPPLQVTHTVEMQHLHKRKTKKTCSPRRDGLFPALLRPRGDPGDSTGPCRQVRRLGARLRHLSGCRHRLSRW